MTYDAAAFEEEFAVSRETVERLQSYMALLREWQARMNLVGRSTLDDLWGRHIRDSAQLAHFGRGLWLDIGAGAGFPGLVLAALGAGQIHLVESTAKKCRFLAAAAAVLAVEDRISVVNGRIEAIPAFHADFITARACANVGQLFEWGLRFATPSTRWLLLKGETVEEEVTAARRLFAFESELRPSITDGRGRILVASGVRRLKVGAG